MNTKRVKTYRLIIKGKVQDVGFRYWFINHAIAFKLKGFIQNLHNKNEVEAIVQGDINSIISIRGNFFIYCRSKSKFTISIKCSLLLFV